MFTQLASPIPVDVIDKGKGMAFAVIDYGPEHNLIWVSALDESGEIWCAPNPKVRLRENWTMGRPRPTASAPEPGSASSSGGSWALRLADAQPTPPPAPRIQAVSIPGADAEHAAFP